MLAFAKKILTNPNDDYRRWTFPRNKKTLVFGLTITLITFTLLSLVDFEYYAEERLANNMPFGLQNYFRLLIVPFINLVAIFLANSTWNNSEKKQNWIAGSILFISWLSCIVSNLVYKYYTGEDFAYDILVLILFSQMLYGLGFRMSFFINFLMVTSTFIICLIDADLIVKKDLIYILALTILIWLPLLIGSYKLEQSNVVNFLNISKLEQAQLKIEEQRQLLNVGEEVSNLATWKVYQDSNKATFSNGIYAIYEFDKEVVMSNMSNVFIPLIHPEDKEELLRQIYKAKNSNQAVSFEHRIILPSGKMKWLRVTKGEMKYGEEIFGTIQDITNEKMMQLELQSSARDLKIKNEDLQQFAYASSHDLQEPLRTISNFINILNKKLDHQLLEEYRTYMDIILQSTDRMSALILAILDYSRIGKNNNLETFDCNLVVQNVLSDLSFAIQSSGANVQVEPLPVIKGYQVEFSSLIQNLISNAIKFRREEVVSEVIIRSLSDQDYHHFCVEDNGIGMEQKHSKKIFQLFSRLHSKEAFEGTGIGLTHSKKIVELHGGKIWVESVKGQGTTFHFNIAKNLTTKKDDKKVELYNVN